MPSIRRHRFLSSLLSVSRLSLGPPPFPPCVPFNIFRSRFTIPEIKRKFIVHCMSGHEHRRRPAQHDRMGIHFAEPFSFWPFAAHSFFELKKKKKKKKKKKIKIFYFFLSPSVFFFFSRQDRAFDYREQTLRSEFPVVRRVTTFVSCNVKTWNLQKSSKK